MIAWWLRIRCDMRRVSGIQARMDFSTNGDAMAKALHHVRMLVAVFLAVAWVVAPAAAQTKSAAADIYIEEGGYVCIEAETTFSKLDMWKKHTDAGFEKWVDGFLGEGCLQFTGNSEVSGPPTSVLTYRIRITNPGKYKLAVRGLEAPIETKEGDKANDCYVRMDGQPDWLGKFTKCVLLGASYEWSWNVKSEYARHKFAIAEYDLAAGVHVFEVAGRSKNFFIDRIVLYKDIDVKQAQSEKLAPSNRAGGDTAAATQPTEPPEPPEPRVFNSEKDLVSLHYDHAPDKDDGHSAAADRTMLLALFDTAWVKAHTLAVSGAYGTNKKTFNKKSDAVMDTCFGDLGGWVAADADWEKAVEALVERWSATLNAGGDIWVKEGGQSDITADVVKIIKQKLPDVETTKRIHVVQHSDWNERHTTPADLTYTKQQTNYIRIKDANRYLNRAGGSDLFVQQALAHPTDGKAWEAAFEYYSPKQRLDFSDTGELMHILGLGEVTLDAFRERFIAPKDDKGDF